MFQLYSSVLRPVAPAAIGAVCALAFLAAPGSACAYSFYTERQLNSSEYVYSPDYAATGSNYGTVRDTTGAAVEYGWTGQRTWSFGNGDGGYVLRNEFSDVYAMADLASGQLKARSVLTVGSNLPGSSGPSAAFGTHAHTASAHATFADTISFGDGTGRPYLWQQGQQFTFNFAVDGQTDLPAGHLAPRTYEDPAYSMAAVRLTVYRAGQGFSNLEAFNDFLKVADFSNPDHLAEINRLNDAINSATLAREVWVVGDSLLSPDWYTSDVHFVPLDESGAALLQYGFEADGDFEFVLSLETTARIDQAYENVTNRIDFSNTLKTSFIAPDDATVYSASGLLPQTIPAVPEPGTWALLTGGLAVLAGAARRRHSLPR